MNVQVKRDNLFQELDEIKVRRGDTVKDGQVIASLKSGVEKAGVKLAKARAQSKTQIESNQVKYQLAQRNLERVNEHGGEPGCR